MNATATPVQLLAQSDLLLLLIEPLDPRSDRALQPPPTRRELDDLLANAGLPLDGPASAATRRLVEAIIATPRQDLVDEYHRLFEGAVLCSINETAYIRRDKGVILADICGFYQAFGVSVRQESGEKADHFTGEAEFIAMLLVMLSAARLAGDVSREEVTSKAIRDFVDDHWGQWLLSMCERLRATAALELYAALADAIEEVWKALAGLHGLPTPAPADGEPPAVDTGSPYECSLAPASTVDVTLDGEAVE